MLHASLQHVSSGWRVKNLRRYALVCRDLVKCDLGTVCGSPHAPIHDGIGSILPPGCGTMRAGARRPSFRNPAAECTCCSSAWQHMAMHVCSPAFGGLQAFAAVTVLKSLQYLIPVGGCDGLLGFGASRCGCSGVLSHMCVADICFS
jgi:hypothetical protein